MHKISQNSRETTEMHTVPMSVKVNRLACVYRIHSIKHPWPKSQFASRWDLHISDTINLHRVTKFTKHHMLATTSSKSNLIHQHAKLKLKRRANFNSPQMCVSWKELVILHYVFGFWKTCQLSGCYQLSFSNSVRWIFKALAKSFAPPEKVFWCFNAIR